jgi:hypothetical protein
MRGLLGCGQATATRWRREDGGRGIGGRQRGSEKGAGAAAAAAGWSRGERTWCAGVGEGGRAG